jgi:hypothetical protein
MLRLKPSQIVCAVGNDDLLHANLDGELNVSRPRVKRPEALDCIGARAHPNKLCGQGKFGEATLQRESQRLHRFSVSRAGLHAAVGGVPRPPDGLIVKSEGVSTSVRLLGCDAYRHGFERLNEEDAWGVCRQVATTQEHVSASRSPWFLIYIVPLRHSGLSVRQSFLLLGSGI